MSEWIVSIPFRYAENNERRKGPACGITVSIPFRYAENAISESYYGDALYEFQFLLGTLKTVSIERSNLVVHHSFNSF